MILEVLQLRSAAVRMTRRYAPFRMTEAFFDGTHSLITLVTLWRGFSALA